MNKLDSYLNKLWKDTLNIIKQDLEQIVFDTYYQDSKLDQLTDNKAIISVPTNTQKIVLETNKDLINLALQEIVEEDLEVEIYNERELKLKPKKTREQFVTLPLDIDYKDNILPHYNFDNFVVGDSNRESHSAALACGLNPGKFYNPLFIFGNSGLGKTHLLHAIGNFVKKNNPEHKVLYITSNDFVTNVVNSIKDNSIEEFKQSMFNLDVLLVDDIQFLAGKEKSHEIFFYIFNELVNNKKQIVLTSDRHPNDLKGLEDRLISRFYSGLSVSVDSPEFEVAIAILEKKIEQHSMDPDLIDNDVLAYLATNFSKDIRKLEGALNRLIFYAINFSDNGRIDMNVANAAFMNQSNNKTEEISMNSIKESVADYYGLTVQQLESNNRTKVISNARHIAMYLARKHLDLSFNKIGQEFGNRDHSTVLSACDKIEKLLKKETSYQIAISEIEKNFLSVNNN